MTMGMNQKKASKGDMKYMGKTEGPMGGSSTGGSRIGKAFTKREAQPKMKEPTGCMEWKG